MQSHSLDPFEEPLRGGLPYYYKASNPNWKKNRSLQGPKRVLRLCILCIILPGLLIGVPLYLKYHVFAYQMYPMGISDMRLIDGKVSTTWCQRQIVRANTTFNAFLLPEVPDVAANRIHVDMIRHLELSDDMKEYWGFYLLKGSTVTVSTCARWPGASMILIRGHRHLHECAYIGDDSSEELEELMEIAAERGIIDLNLEESSESPANRVELLRKRRPEVQFHDEKLRDNAESFTFAPSQELAKDSEDNISGKRMQALLNVLPHKANKFKANVAMNATHIGKQVDRLKQQLKIEIENRERMQNGEPTNAVPSTINLADLIRLHQADHLHITRETNVKDSEYDNVQFYAPANGRRPGANGTELSVNATSNEILASLTRQLGHLDAARRTRILNELRNQNVEVLDSQTKAGAAGDKASTPSDGVARDASEPPNSAAREQPTESTAPESSPASIPVAATAPLPSAIPAAEATEKLIRAKRQFFLEKELSSAADESENLAIEEGYSPDGIADHHQVLNQTTLNDRSNSEFWSSFSSSEEALLNCAGLILSLPLSPNERCHSDGDEADFDRASRSNRITYTVPTNGYYFFVFNSENEVQTNYIRVKFDIHKTVYNVSNSLHSCSNSTEECRLPLNFFSNQKVVFELPLNNDEALWNEEYVVISECEPRTAIYLICVISVPLSILIFAFQ